MAPTDETASPAVGSGAVPTGSALIGRRVLIVSMYYAPEVSGSAPYTTDLAEHLLARGAGVEVVTTHPHYPQWRRAGESVNRWQREERDGVTVWRVPGYIPAVPSASRRLAYESSYVAAASGLIASRRPDVIVGCSPGVFAAALAGTVARASDIPLVHWVQDVVSSAATQSGIGMGTRAARVLSRLEGVALRQSSAVAVPSQSFVPAVERLTCGRVPIRVVRNWSRVPDLSTLDGTSRRRLLGWENRTVVLHTGNLGQKQGIDELLPALTALNDRHPNLLFVFTGDGNQRAGLQAAARKLRNIQLMDPVDSDVYLELLRAADVLLVHERSTVVDMSLPSKLTSYFASGRPVVAVTRSDSATALEIATSGAGVTVPHGSPDRLAEAIVSLAGTDLGRATAGRGLDFHRAVLSPSAALTGLEQLITAVSVGARGRRWPTGPKRTIIDLRDPRTTAKIPTQPDRRTHAPNPRVTVGVPAFNESERIEETVRSILDALAAHYRPEEWEVLAVDDGSTDSTAELLHRLSEETPGVRYVTHARNLGLGGSLTTLFQESRGATVVAIDADLSYDVTHIHRLVAARELTRAAVAVASPYSAGGRTIAVPRDLEMRSRLANRYLTAMSRLPVRTYTGMVRAYDRTFIRTLPPLRAGASSNVEILAHAWRLGLPVVELPATLDWTGRQSRRDRTSVLSRDSVEESLRLLADGIRLRRGS